MHYVIKTETGLQITNHNPVEQENNIEFCGPVEQCQMFVLISNQ